MTNQSLFSIISRYKTAAPNAGRRMQHCRRLLGLAAFFLAVLLLGWRSTRCPNLAEEFLEIRRMLEAQPAVAYEHNPRYAYVCLCANLRAVYPTLVLFQQLSRAKAHRGVHVALVSADVPEEYRRILAAFQIAVEVYSPSPLFRIPYETHSKSTRERDRILWNKLRVWSLAAYERVVMLDYDLLVLKNFDELFDLDELAGVPMLYRDEKIAFWEDPHVGDDPSVVWRNLTKISAPTIGHTGLNSGVLVLRPSLATFRELVEAASRLTERPCCPSQEFLYRFFEVRGRYRRLPPIYNLRKIHLLSEEEQRHYNQTAKIYHFVERMKPIVMGRQQAQHDYFAAQWWGHARLVDRRLDSLDLSPTLIRTIRVEAIRSALS